MSESVVIDAPHSTKPAKRKRWPGTFHTAPIFGGRTIAAMGTRPQDHMDRDLLLASLLRDRRLPMFRQQCLELPTWAPKVPDCIPKAFRHRAQELIMLGSHHRYLIEKMRDAIDLAADRCQGEQMLRAMEHCLPRGALFARQMPDPGRACGYARLCPWCHARSVQRFYRRLLDGPCAPQRLAGKYLITFRTRLEVGQNLESGKVRDARDNYRGKLRFLADKLGIEGGLIIHQVTPWIPHYDRPDEKKKGFAHIFTMIGVSASPIEALGVDLAEQCSDLWLNWDYETASLPSETPHALRYLIVGSSYRFDSSELGIVVNDWQRLRYGIQGAAALEPWFLFDERQAWSYAAAMQGTRLYDSFGTWRRSRTGSSPKRRAQSENGNSRRRDEANDRRNQLVAVALPYYQKFKDAGGKQLGSPALRKTLKEAGHAVTDRDARWLAKKLPEQDTRSGLEKFTAKRKLHLLGGKSCDPGLLAPVEIT